MGANAQETEEMAIIEQPPAERSNARSRFRTRRRKSRTRDRKHSWTENDISEKSLEHFIDLFIFMAQQQPKL